MIISYPDRPEVDQALKEKFDIGNPCYGSYKEENHCRITSFCAAGAKNYSYRMEDGSTVVKARGFSLNNDTAKSVLNHDSMLALMKKWDRGEEDQVSTESFTMKLDRKTQTIRNSTLKKTYRNSVYDKRYILKGTPSMKTLPFGTRGISQ